MLIKDKVKAVIRDYYEVNYVGRKVYFMYLNKITCGKITKIDENFDIDIDSRLSLSSDTSIYFTADELIADLELDIVELP
jgi:hypothetical protein